MNKHNRARMILFLFCLAAFLPLVSLAQDPSQLSLRKATLSQAVKFAIDNQPLVQQNMLDEQITAAQIRSRLADWYPQVNFNYSLQHNFIVQTSIIAGNTVKLGSSNISAAQFSASQTIFNRDVLLARRTRQQVMQEARLATTEEKIALAADVSKAFYDVLSTIQQINLAASNIVRIERSLKDAYYQYEAGVADKIDYKRATIILNNTKAAKSSNEALLSAKIQNLKQLMNFPENAPLDIVYDSLQMENEIFLDTLQGPDYTKRVEYQQLQTQKALLDANLRYNRWSYLPSLSANAAYNLNFQNNNFAKLYNTNYPNSYAGITLGFPIFQGGRRKADINVARLQLQRNALDLAYLQTAVNTEYIQALGTYKSNLATYLALKENVALAQEVYDVVQLQYRSGIKTYLEVVTSETDLRTAQINYYNAIYQLLASKIDVQKSLGTINY